MSETAWVSHKCPVCAGTGTVNATNASGDLIPPSNPGQTHYEGCERAPGHHGCALDKLDAMCDAAQSLLMLLDEWAWTAHHTVQSPGVKATVAQDDMILRRNELWALVAAARAQP